MDKYSSISKTERLLKSPRKQAIEVELNQHAIRMKQIMHQDYILLEEQNAQLKVKCKKVTELEGKVELVLRSNNQLLVQNQKLAKFVEEKIQECQMLKRKLQSAKRAGEGLNQYERKKLLLERERLQKQIQQIEHLKNMTIKQVKTKHMIEIESLRKDHEVGLKLYDEQVLKIKQQLDKKDIEINVLQAKLRKAQSDSQYELTQSKQEKMKIRQEIKKVEPYVKLYEDLKEQYEKVNIQLDKLKEEKKKQDENNAQNIRQTVEKSKKDLQQLKKQSSQRIQGLEQQNTALDTKNKKLQKSTQQLSENLFQTQKSLERTSAEYQKAHRQCDHLRNQIKELQIINDKEVIALQKKYESLQVQEIGEIQVHHEQYRMFAEKQMAKLSQIIRIKEEELLYLSEEKSRMKQGFIEEGNLMKNQLIILQQEFRDGEIMHADEIGKLQQQYRINMRTLEQQLLQRLHKNEAQHSAKAQQASEQSIKKIKKLQSELVSIDKQKRKVCQDLHKKTAQSTAYKDIIENQKQQMRQISKRWEERQKTWKKDEQIYKNTIIEGKQKMKGVQEQLIKEREDWRKEQSRLEREFREGLAEKNKIIDKLEKENQTFKDFIGNRDKSLLQINARISQLNRQLEQKNSTIDMLRIQITQISQKGSKKLSQQKISLVQYYSHQLTLLTEDHNTKITLLQAKIEQLRLIVQRKDKQIEQLLRQYKKMRDQMITLTQQQANKKELSLKFVGANADLIATKNMFDVFVKGKVLDVCGDVVRDVVEGRNAGEGEGRDAGEGRENVQPKTT